MKKFKERKAKGELSIKRISVVIISILLLQMILPVIGKLNIVSNVYGTDLWDDINGNVFYTEKSGNIYAEIRDLDVENLIIVSSYNDRKVYSFSIIGVQNGINEFKNLKKLKKLTIPVQLLQDELIGNYFVNANSIEEITFTGTGSYDNDSRVKVYKGLADLPNLKKITIGEGITSIEEAAFANCKSLQEVEISSSQLNDISKGAFSHCNELTKVTIKSTNLNTIGTMAFYSCEKLEKVRIETESIHTISYQAFKNCQNLLDFYFVYRNYLKNIDNEAFCGCKRLGYYYDHGYAKIVGENIESIGDYAFKDCGWFGYDDTVFEMLNPNLSHIGEGAFYHTAIMSADLKESKLTEIPDYAFAYCRYLSSISFPDSLKRIGNGAFLNSNGGDNIQSSGSPAGSIHNNYVKIPDSVTEIGEYAFANYNDKNLQLPGSNINIKEGAFFGYRGKISCPYGSSADYYLTTRKIEHTTFEEENKTFENEGFQYIISGGNAIVAKYKGSSSNVKIPAEVIDTENNKSWEVTEIGEAAFEGQRIDTVVIPECVNKINAKAFANCSNLKRVFIGENVNFIADNAFDGSNNQYLTIYCNSNSYAEKYANSKKNIGCRILNNADNKNNSTMKTSSTSTSSGKQNSIKTASISSNSQADTTPPAVTVSLSSSKEAAKYVDITWTGADVGGLSGWKITQSSNESYGTYNKISVGSIKNTTRELNNGTYYLYVKDNNNNVTKKAIEINNIDKVSPTITLNSFTPQSGWSTKVMVSVTAKDDGVGVKYWKITNNTDVTDEGYNEFDKCTSSITKSFKITKNGTYYLWIKDDNGNWAYQGFTINSIDEVSPIIANTEIRYYQGYSYIDWTAYDYGVGVKYWKVSKNEKEYGGNYNTYSNAEKEQKGSYKITESGIYYLYIKDDRGNVTCRKIDVKVDSAKPTIKNIKVNKNDNNAYICFSFSDEGSGVKLWKLSKNADGSDGTYETCKYNGKDSNLSSGSINARIDKNGTYYIVIKDACGWTTISNPIYVDFTRPYIEKIERISNTGKTISDVNYIKEGSELTFRVTFSEIVKNVDESKIKLVGKNNVNSTIRLNKISNIAYDIIITGSKNDNQELSVSIENGFLTDYNNNISLKSKVADKIKIVADNLAPDIEATHIDNTITTKMTDLSGITKYQWFVIGDHDETLWSSDLKENIKQSVINYKWSLVRYKGKRVRLYVEDVLGNSKTYTINPEIQAVVEFVSREGNLVKYRISTNLFSRINKDGLNSINKDNVNSCKIEGLEAEDDSGKKFIVTVNTNGSTSKEDIKLPKGIIYVVHPDDPKEAEITIKVDNIAPTINLGVYDSVKKQREINLSFMLGDSDSGIKQYEFSRGGNLIKRKVVDSEGNYNDSIVVVRNGVLKLTVWDNQGNKTEKDITFDNLDRTAPKLNNLTYSKPDKNGDVLVTITSNEKVTIDGFTNISNTIKQKKYKEEELTGTGIKDVVKLVDEAGNELEVNLTDKIAPRVVGDIIKTAVSSTVTDVEINFNEQIQLTEEQISSGWTLSKDKKKVTKSMSANEDLVVTDLAGNEIENIINVEIINSLSNKLYKEKKNEPTDTSQPATQVIKYIYLKRPIQSVDLQTLTGHATYELIDDNKTIKLIFNKRINYSHKIRMIENENYAEYLTVLSVKNVVKKGDSNNNGTITNEDLNIMKDVAVGTNTETDKFKLYAMDMNDDGKIDIEDISELTKLLSKN